MKNIPVTRASYLMEFTRWLRKIGAPVDSELARARLPVFFEDTPDAYISLNLVVVFLMRNATKESVHDLGFSAGWQTRFDNFTPIMKHALQNAPGTRARIENFIRFVHLEDNTVKASMKREGKAVRVCISGDYPELDLQITEWQQIKALIEVVRSGESHWLPTEITFRSCFTPGPTAFAQLGDTRIRTGQPETSILFPLSVLGASPVIFDEQTETNQNSIVTLRKAIEPYLASGGPPIELAAEIVGSSKRSLQRHLSEQQTSYSELIDHARFDKASHLLADQDMKIVDVALAVGYQDSSNFSRAFRRISGLGPREFRKQYIT